MELLLINHPLDCPICDKGGECPLQNQAMSNGRADSRFLEKKRTFPKPIAISSNVLLDRERCVLCQRCTRFSEQIAGDPFIDLLERGARAADRDERRGPVPVLLLRQHRADLPGRRADQRVVPLPRAAVRPALDRLGLRALRVRAARSAPTGGAARSPAAWPATTRGQRGVELRQGPLGVPVRRPGRPAHRAARPQRRGRARRDQLAVRARARRDRPARSRRPRRRRRAARRPAHRGGRVRVREVRARRARHERHRLPRASGQRRGTVLPRRTRRRHDAAARVLRIARDGAGRPARRARARGGVADPVPAAAQGRAQERRAGVLDRAVRVARAAQARRHADPHRPRRRGDRRRPARRQRHQDAVPARCA